MIETTPPEYGCVGYFVGDIGGGIATTYTNVDGNNRPLGVAAPSCAAIVTTVTDDYDVANSGAGRFLNKKGGDFLVELKLVDRFGNGLARLCVE